MLPVGGQTKNGHFSKVRLLEKAATKSFFGSERKEKFGDLLCKRIKLAKERFGD